MISFAGDDDCPYPTPPFYADKPFFFDAFTFSVANKDTTSRMEAIEGKEGRLSNTYFGLPSLFTGVSELFGSCGDWWPENLAIPFGFEYQALLGQLDFGENFGARFSGHNYKLFLAGRWYISPNTLSPLNVDSDTVTFVAIEDTHWSPHTGESVSIDGNDTVEEYMILNDINFSGLAVIDVFSLQIAQQFTLFDDDLRIEYRLGKNLFQAAISDALKQDSWHSYPYPWFLEARSSYFLTENTALSFTAQSEFSSDEQPYMAEVALNTYFRRLPHEGFRFFYRWFGGIDDNTLISTRFGIWTSSPMTGFEFETRPQFLN